MVNCEPLYFGHLYLPIQPNLPINYNLFMQNKPNLPKAQMNLTSLITVDYENKSNWKLGENKPNTKPIQTQSKPKQTQLSPKQSQNKPNMNPKQTQSNPIKPNFKGKKLNYSNQTSMRFKAKWTGEMQRGHPAPLSMRFG